MRGVKIPKLLYPLDGKSLSEEDKDKDGDEVRAVAKTHCRAIIGMLRYIAGHIKPDVAPALNVLSRYCNNQGRRRIIFLNHRVKYCEYSKDVRLKFYAHHDPYDAKTMRSLTQARFQCDADLAGNMDNIHSRIAHFRYIGNNSVVSVR